METEMGGREGACVYRGEGQRREMGRVHMEREHAATEGMVMV